MQNLSRKHHRLSHSQGKSNVTSVAWTPDGRRLFAGNDRGQFTLWSGDAFTHEGTHSAHDSLQPDVLSLAWTHDGSYVVSGCKGGTIYYNKSSLVFVRKIERAHKEGVQGISFAPSDEKFASCSDDGTVKVWDLGRSRDEHSAEATLVGHGGDVKSVAWHPHKALLASGSKDTSAKLWDARTNRAVATLHGHKAAVRIRNGRTRGERAARAYMND